MSYLLWIEDFDNSVKATAHEVLGNLDIDGNFAEEKRQLKNDLKKYGIFIELSFQNGLNFIRKQLQEIDYVIIDINLPAISDGDSVNDDVLKLLADFYEYQEQQDEIEDEALQAEKREKLREIAGFHLYTELVFELGFPRNHILFCSNHGEEMKSIQEAFKTAKMPMPTIYRKSDNYVKNWVREHYKNSYSCLRRGIIEACHHLKKLSEYRLLRFNDFIKESDKQVTFYEMHDYLTILENFFPLREPEDKGAWYKLFIRALTHEWEAAEYERINKQNRQQGMYAFSQIMKISRNWSTHSKIFEKSTTQDVAYLFIINMRAMFDLKDELLPYEKKLLHLFSNIMSVDDMREKMGTDYESRKIPLANNYALLIKETGNTWQAINFNDALNNLQKSKVVDSRILIRGLYQIFWFLTSNGNIHLLVNEEEKINASATLNYQFKYFDYQKKAYLFEIARHIYNHSFL